MKRFFFATISGLGLSVLAIPTDAAALCGADYWGGRNNNLIKRSETSITTQATTVVVHQTAHLSCSGAFEAFPFLERNMGGGTWMGVCDGEWSAMTHTSSGSNTVVSASKDCTGLMQGFYQSRGKHKGFGEAEYISDARHQIDIAGEEPDNDEDGHPADSDCDDADPNVYPGAPIDCGMVSYGDDKNCNGQNDYDELGCGIEEPPCGSASPIIIDIAGDGVTLTGSANGVRFDLDANGVKEALPWTVFESDDAWLALDRNANGTVDSGAELFGNFTPQPSSLFPNGFIALAQFDTRDKGGNGDGVIDGADSVYSQLWLWRDMNHDGISQPSELLRLNDAGISRLSLDYRESQKRDYWGNEFRYRAKVDGPGSPWAYDVFFEGAKGSIR